ncbi:hypothetical protein [Streptomyces sp. NPDC003299]
MTAEQDDAALLGLPGVQGQLGSIAADLTAGLNCLWLLPDRLVDTGDAEQLYRAALNMAPDRLDVQPPTVLTVPGPRAADAREGGGGAAGHDEKFREEDDVWDDLPDLDFDSGFDIGWSDALPVCTRPRAREHAVPDLFERLGKELAVGPGEVIERLTHRTGRWRPVIGLRAWREPDDPGGIAPRGTESTLRGGAVARLFRSLTAAVKDAGLHPQERPRLLVVARFRDLPEALVNELDRDIATTAVHWWWGTLGRVDTAVVVAAARGRAPGGALEQRILAAVREETVTDLSAFDLSLAQRLAVAWDGTTTRLDKALRSCLDSALITEAASCPEGPLDAGARRRPGSALRRAWAQGLVQSWEGRLRRHPASWYASGQSATPPELSVLMGQAQLRVLSPWIEATREQLARLGARYATQPLYTLVSAYSQRPPANLQDRPEEVFQQLEVGSLLTAHYGGGIAFPGEELSLLKEVVRVRNILAHRGVLRDHTLHALCEELTLAFRRWAKL